MNLGDFRLGDTIDFKFSTCTTAGAPITLAGTPSLKVYRGNGATEITAGITLTADFDSVTGLHHARIVASEANGYAWGDQCDVVVHQGTVSGQSIAGTVLRHFSVDALQRDRVLAKAAGGGTNYVDVPSGTKVGVGDEACTQPNGATAEGSSQKVKTVTVGGGTGASDRVVMTGNWNGPVPASGTYVAFRKTDGMESAVVNVYASGMIPASFDGFGGVAYDGDGTEGNNIRPAGVPVSA